MGKQKRLNVRGFPREVGQMLTTLVADHGVKYRQSDGRHVLLYSGDRESRPYKVSAMQVVPVTLKHLNEWARENVAGWDES